MNKQSNSSLYGSGASSFQAAGGQDGVHKLVADFYRIMDESADAQRIRDMHPKDLTLATDKLFTFLCGWLGGPKLYQEKYGGISIPGAHSPFPIEERDRDSWLSCMQQSIDLQNYMPDFAEYLIAQLRIPANRIVEVAKKRAQSLPKETD